MPEHGRIQNDEIKKKMCFCWVGLRRGVHRHCACSRGCGGAGQAAATRQGANLYGCTGGDHPHDLWRAGRWPDLRPTGEEGDRSLARARICHRDRDPSTQGYSRQRDCGLSRLPASRMTMASSGCGTPINMDVGRFRRPPWRRASEKKWPEARSWCKRRHLNKLNKGYVLRTKGKPDPTPARAEKRTASRYYQLKLGHALTGVYLKSTDNSPDDHCWWCDPENNFGTQQTRDHLFKHCYKWNAQQTVRWARVKEATKRAKRKWPTGRREVQPGDARLFVEYLRWTSGSPS